MQSQMCKRPWPRALWRPEDGDHYFTILADGNIRRLPWYGTPFDYDAWQFGNCFKKSAEAKQAREHIHELLHFFHHSLCLPSSETTSWQQSWPVLQGRG